MWRKLVLAWIVVFIVAAGVHAQGPDNGVKHSDPTWKAAYWNNMTLSGAPVLEEQSPTLGGDWGAGAPRAGVHADHFSARWTRYVDLGAATYRFAAISDDGIRLYVDGVLRIDQWNDHPVRTYTADVALQAGHHQITVEYYENGGAAVAGLSWSVVTADDDRWHAEYYANTWLGGAPAVLRAESRIAFDWGYGSPAAGVPSDGFSARWTRTLRLQPGVYCFSAAADDGLRLWVDGHLLIDAWRDQSLTHYEGTIYVDGETPVVFEYYENGGVASAHLSWARAGDEPPASGAIVVDNTEMGFVAGGSNTAWHRAQDGVNGLMIWTRNNDRVRHNYNWARWYPKLSRGSYEVFVYVPQTHATTHAARYWVSHLDGYTLVVVDQGANRGRWVSLGSYRFRGGDADYVSLSDVTYESYLAYDIAFDAVKWVRR